MQNIDMKRLVETGKRKRHRLSDAVLIRSKRLQDEVYALRR
jgi:hypothetical protein